MVLARIEADLAAGRWAIGERLPAERALAEELGVSRASVREAIRVLEAMGIVRTAVGSGPDAGAHVINRPAAGLGSAMRLHLAAGTLPGRDAVDHHITAFAAEAGLSPRSSPMPPPARPLPELVTHLPTS